MRIEMWLVLGAIFFIADTAHDHKYSKALLQYKKHAKIAAAVFSLFSVYLYTRNNPGESSQMLHHLNGMIRYMPLDQSSKDLISPFFQSYGERRVTTSGQPPLGGNGAGGSTATIRSVSSTKKKYVAASQGWKCGSCKQQLDAWFEVDHTQRLADGGSNHVSNLVALCRNCHGKKTMFEIM